MNAFIRYIYLLPATSFGLGLIPIASGTFGALPGILIVWVLSYLLELGVGWMILISLILTIIAIPICDVAEKYFGKKDDNKIVADEALTFPICMIGLPPQPIMLIIAFIVSRILDILKPPPARYLQTLHGGLGIVIDDFIANLYALIFNHLIYYILGYFGLF